MARLSTLIVGVSLAAATLTLPAAANAADAGAYTVQEGDTLSGIAAVVDVPLADLLQANNLTVTSVILPGQHLEIPEGAEGGSSTGAGSTHRVAAGDTLSGIALRYDVSLSSFLELNGLSTASLITPGMQLALPAGGRAASATPNSPAQRVVDFALTQVGKPYVFFTKGPSTFDCSGLSLAAYAQVGVPLVHQAAAQAQQGSAVDHWNEAIRTGDLIFLDADWDRVIDHVGIALNATTWVQASQSNDTVLTGPIPSDSVIVAVRRFLSD